MPLNELVNDATPMHLDELTTSHIHFVGVGGIGMSGLAQILFQRGYPVSGSDLSTNENIQRLQEAGIPIILGHNAATITGKDIVVISTAVKETNPELQEARKKNLTILHRADILALILAGQKSIAISGTHGKTTTTGLMGWVLEIAALDPTIINGGIMNGWGSNVKVGKGEWYVAEADESDGSFVKLPRHISLITNIDADHMDYYTSLEHLHDAFETFAIDLATPEGLTVLGIDSPQTYVLWQKIRNSQRCVSYGIHPEAELQAHNIQLTSKGATFDLVTEGFSIPIVLSLHGHHNVLNALGVAAVAFECGVSPEMLQKAFTSFEGVQRRFTPVGEWNDVTIIDDYAHHPVEIKATLAAARAATSGRIIAVLEPHRYSRLEHHFQDFTTSCEAADITIVLPVYGAREAPREGITHQALVTEMQGDVHACDGPAHLLELLQRFARPGDMVLCLGAGTISAISRSLASQLTQTSPHIRA